MRIRFSPLGGALSAGMPPNELWGVSNGPKQRRRGEKARARRRAKKAARRVGVTLKAYLRTVK